MGFFVKLALLKTTKKREQFENFLLSNSDADDWLSSLPDAEKDTWANLKCAFNKQYPKPAKIKKTSSQYEDELLATVLKEETLGLKVQRGGIDKWSHVAWVEDLLAIAKSANFAAGTQYISMVRKRMPDLLREKVSTNYANWEEFASAVRTVNVDFIIEGADRLRRIAKEKQELDQRFRRLEAASPTAPLRTQMSQARISDSTPTSPSPASRISRVTPAGRSPTAIYLRALLRRALRSSPWSTRQPHAPF